MNSYDNEKKTKEYMKQYAKDNKEKLKKYKHDWYIKNFDNISKKAKITRQLPEVKARAKEYKSSQEYKEKQRLFRKTQHFMDWREKNKESIALSKHQHYIKNKQKIKDRVKKWVVDNRERERKYRRDRARERMLNDKVFRIKHRLRARLRHGFNAYSKNGKIRKSCEYGIDYKAIIEHLKPFPENLSEYQIDHIRPLCSFDLEKRDQIKEAFAPENHQWLTSFENQSKGGKY